MRDIKFRIFNKTNKEWDHWTLDQIALTGIGDISKERVCEFTGLQDSNGTDVYEGDILDFDRKLIADRVIPGQYYYAVKWDDCQWMMRYAPRQVPFWTNNARNSTVVGNIYQNKEITKIFVEFWLSGLTESQLVVTRGLTEMFKLKKFNPQDKTMDQEIERSIEVLYKSDEDYLKELNQEFPDFPDLVKDVFSTPTQPIVNKDSQIT